MTVTLAACLITKNEATSLADCLRSLQHQVDEIIVIDTGSTDDTMDIARSFQARVGTMTWQGDFSHARNYCMNAATTDIILNLDADEIAPADLRTQVEQLATTAPQADPFLGRLLIRSPYVDEQGERRVAVSHVTRLCTRMPSIRFTGAIHEQLIDLTGTAKRITTPIVIEHGGYDLPPERMMAKTQRNIALLEQSLSQSSITAEKRAYYLYQLGKSQSVMRQHGAAKESFASSLAQTSPDSAYHPELLLAYLHTLKRLDQATEIWPLLTSALQRYPTLPDLHFFMAGALIHFAVPDLALIERCYHTCIAIGDQIARYPSVEGTGSYLAYYNLGAFYEVTGRYEEAIRAYQQAERLGYGTVKTALTRVHDKRS